MYIRSDIFYYYYITPKSGLDLFTFLRITPFAWEIIYNINPNQLLYPFIIYPPSSIPHQKMSSSACKSPLYRLLLHYNHGYGYQRTNEIDSTPPPNRRPPLRHNSSTTSFTAPPHNSPVRSFSMPTTISSGSPSSSRGSPNTSRRGSWDCEKMSDFNEKDQEIYMGALVSPGSGDWEKSIEVPCIILSTSCSPCILSPPSSLAPLSTHPRYEVIRETQYSRRDR